MENLKLETKNNSLEIISVQNTKLEKEHLQFNKLCKSIEKLQREIIAVQSKYQSLLDYYLLNNRPYFINFSECQYQMIQLLDKRSKEFKLSKRQHEILGFTITEIFESAIEFVMPSDELIALFDRWNEEYTFKMRVENQKDEIKEEFSSMVWENFGLDIDPDEIDDSDENLKKLEDKFKKFMEEQESKNSNGKKSSKENKKIHLEKAKEELQEKTVRKIYLALAKILHPDTYLNEDEKLEREEIMKQVNLAYENKDLYALLKLEMEWMNKNPESLSDKNTLKLYIEVLNDQIMELREKKYFIRMDPKWDQIIEWIDDTEKDAKYKMEYKKSMQIKQLNKCQKDLKELKTVNNPRHNIIAILKEFEPAYTHASNFDMW